MSVKIRLKRMGSKKKPYFRLIVVDSRFPGKGRRVEDVGTYNPRSTDNHVLNLNQEAIAAWVKKGAVPSETVTGILKKAGVKL
ncbi:MAG TPA: 30S ribosomal protein S16 [bacterium]|nr:30S ribosomal protein S16 [bacterium]